MPTYIIGAGDSLQITVWRNAELSTSVTVRPDGRISVPLIDDLTAAGKTPAELADDIEQELAVYLREPDVTVSLLSGQGDLGQQIRIVGEAVNPVALPYRAGMTLLDAVIAGGGLSRQAAGNSAVVLRRTDGGREQIPVRLADLVRDGDGRANMALQPGDIIIIPEGFLTGEWRVDYRVTASETFSDNIDQDPDDERESGFVTRAGPGITIRGNTARVQASFTGDLAGVHQIGGDDEGFSVDPRIAGTSTTEILSDQLFFDLSTSVRRQLLDSRESTSASGATTGQTDTVAVLTASPYFVHRLGSFANAEWRYRFSPVLVGSGDESDVLSHEASLALRSGRDFSFLSWTLTNSVSEEVRSDDDNIRTANSNLGVAYPLWRGFNLLGNVGYELRDGDEGDDDENFSGITWSGGFAYQPHPDLEVQATYGRRQDDENLDASLNYRISPKTSIVASYSEALQTSQGRAISALTDITIDPDTGEIIDVGTGQPFEGDTGPFTFEDETTRTETFRLNATHRSGRDSFGLSGLFGTREGGTGGDETFYTASATWSRPLTPLLNFSSRASFDRSEFDEDDRTDDNYRASLALNYRLASNASASLAYNFQTRDSSDDDESFLENAVTLGLSVSF